MRKGYPGNCDFRCGCKWPCFPLPRRLWGKTQLRAEWRVPHVFFSVLACALAECLGVQWAERYYFSNMFLRKSASEPIESAQNLEYRYCFRAENNATRIHMGRSLISSPNPEQSSPARKRALPTRNGA